VLGGISVTEGTAVTQYSYPGASVVVTDPKNRVTVYEYSAFGSPGDRQLTLVKDADNKFTRYSYDAFGNLTRVNGPNASGLIGSAPERTWWYDHRNMLQGDTQPEKGVTTYLHDPGGNLREVTDATGTTYLYYDGNNRLWKRDAPGTGDDVEISYGAAGQVLQMASPTLPSPVTRTTLGYDVAGRVNSRADLANGQTFTSQYQYFPDDTLDRLTYPFLRAITYEYVQGRLSLVKNNGTIFADNFSYSDSGRLAGYRTGSVTHVITYDARERVKTIKAGTLPTGLDLTYTYDDANQVEEIADPRPAMNQMFEYDAVGRVWAADGPYGALRWSYDATGNRLTETRGLITNYNYDPPTQRLLSTSGAIAETFTYDALGRLASDSRGTYTYNARSLLATATAPGVSATYGYDPAGLRTTRTVNGDTTYTIRGAGGDALSEYVAPCGAPVWARDLVYAGGRLLGAVRANLTPPSVAVTAATASVPEPQTAVSVGVRLTTASGSPTTCPVTVAYHTPPGTATVGADYTTAHGTLTFPAGTTSGTVLSVSITLLPDAADEPNETFVLALSSAIGAEVVAPAGQTITIEDDDAAPLMAIEAPTHGATVKTPFAITGWAFDGTAPTGTGVDVIHVYATPAGGSPSFLGAATYGLARPDIGALYGSRFTNSGYTLTASLTPGGYTITVYARSTATGTFNQAQAIAVTVAPADPRMALESPGAGWELPQPFPLTGWAIDLGSGAGTGVARVEILAHPNPGSGAPPIALGDATYGIARSDVGQTYGVPFTNSGYQKEIRGLTPGVYRLEARAWSTVTGTVNQTRDVTLTVLANPRMWVDTPGSGTTVNQAFHIGGWAVDLAAASGTGVSTVHIWAYPNPGSGAPPIFLGAAVYGGARPDIANLYGSQFLNAGFGLNVTLGPGPYQIVVYAFSTVANTFNQAQSLLVTVATSQPMIAIDLPTANSTVAQPFSVAGWAIDRGSPSGTGVDVVHVYAIANGGAGASTFLGAAPYGGARPDVGQLYGSQFTNSGYGLTASGLAPGAYQINVYAHSTVSGLWPVQSVWVTVQ